MRKLPSFRSLDGERVLVTICIQLIGSIYYLPRHLPPLNGTVGICTRRDL